jgi:energy-coupling factor transport system ATP-binding protein
MSDIILEAKELEFSYRDTKILDNINLSFREGSFIGITGKNGSGKSTLGRLLAGLLRPQSGGVFFESEKIDEKTIHKLRPNISMVFQNPNNQIIANKVEDDMAFGLENLGMNRPQMVKVIYEVSRRLGIEELLHKNPEELSGGQKQIVAIGGILVFNPKIIILDEITSMLDLKSKKKVFELIKELKKEHTVIMISHDSKELSETDRIIIMDKGKVVEDTIPKSLFCNKELLDKYRLEQPFEYELLEKMGRERYESMGVSK